MPSPVEGSGGKQINIIMIQSPISSVRPGVIGIAGPFGAGKDTLAAILSDYGYHRRAFGDSLKQELADLLGRSEPSIVEAALPREIQDLIRFFRFPNTYRIFFRRAPRLGGAAAVWHKPTHPKMRRLLQWWGTEYRRSRFPDYWVSRIDIPELVNIAITDIRFRNEAKWVQQQGGQLWYVARTLKAGSVDLALRTHASEDHDMQFAGIAFDRRISNDGSIFDLEAHVADCLR